MIKEDKYDIGIISFSMHSEGYNFGAALHSYAFQKYLDKIGISNVIINYYPKTLLKNHIFWEMLQNILMFQFIRFSKNLIKWKHIKTKREKFYKFFKENCNITNNQYSVRTLTKLDTISRFVCETDVTWAKLKGGFDRVFYVIYLI